MHARRKLAHYFTGFSACIYMQAERVPARAGAGLLRYRKSNLTMSRLKVHRLKTNAMIYLFHDVKLAQS